MNLQAIAQKAREFIVRKYGSPPHGGCLEASKYIARLLRKQGIEAVIAHGNFAGDADLPHWWVRSGEWLIDVTADQFTEEDTESIVVGKASELRQWVTYKDRAFASSVR